MHSTRPALIAALAALLVAPPAFAQLQSKHQIKCLNELAKCAVLVSQAQGDDDAACVKAAGKDDLPMSADDCLSADLRNKVAKREQRTLSKGTSKCEIEQPSFGATDPDTVNSTASGRQIDLAGDLFGPDLASALVSCADDHDGCKCQARVARAAGRVAYAHVKEFTACMKGAIKVNKQPFLSGAVSAEDLEACLSDPGTPHSVAADERHKIEKAEAKLARAVLACPSGDYFPGPCVGTAGSDLATCLAQRADCQACTAINTMFALAANCAACE